MSWYRSVAVVDVQYCGLFFESNGPVRTSRSLPHSVLNSITIPRSGVSPTFLTVWITGGLKLGRSGKVSTNFDGSPSGHC